MKHLPSSREGIGPTTLAPTKTAVNIEIVTVIAAENGKEVGVTHLGAYKRNFRGLGGKR